MKEVIFEKLSADFLFHGDPEEVEKAMSLQREQLRYVFGAIASGIFKIASYECPAVERCGHVSKVCYALHKSTKQLGKLQLSCWENRDGAIIANSDLQYSFNDFTGLYRDHSPNGIVIKLQ